MTLNSTLASSMPSGDATAIAAAFNVKDDVQQVPLVSVFMIGYILGPFLFGPLSEVYGRRLVLLTALSLFMVFTLGVALAPTWYGFLIFRFLVGTNASAALTISPGIFADLLPNPVTRGQAIALFTATTNLGPAMAPTISGFLSTVSWRWPFWAELIFAGVTLGPGFFLFPETFAPVLPAKRAAKLQRGTVQDVTSLHQNKRSWQHVATIVLMRPVKMMVSEPIVLLASLYMAFIYGLL
jgi:MFS family permease